MVELLVVEALTTCKLVLVAAPNESWSVEHSNNLVVELYTSLEVVALQDAKPAPEIEPSDAVPVTFTVVKFPLVAVMSPPWVDATYPLNWAVPGKLTIGCEFPEPAGPCGPCGPAGPCGPGTARSITW